MPHEFKLSSFGLKLIKAYEGFRSAETTLVSGQRVIGYGHRYMLDEEPLISREKAEKILKADLEPYQDLVNESIFAPLTQSQYDALVSLAFNIGPRAFLASNVLQGMNNGRPLEAAAGFDEWCRSNINGKTYVVDALVRRRTAEKALFLRPTDGAVPAPRNEIPPKRVQHSTLIDAQTPVYGRANEDGIVDRAPYDAEITNRADGANIDQLRKEDGPAGQMTLSELAPQFGDEHDPEMESLDTPLANEEGMSPIAVAAAEVSERLDRLIAQEPKGQAETNSSKPLATSTGSRIVETEQSVLDLPTSSIEAPLPEAANDGTHPQYRRPGRRDAVRVRSPEAYIDRAPLKPESAEKEGFGAYWFTLFAGASLFGAGATRWFLSPDDGLAEMSEFLAPVATIVGGMVVLGAIYYLIKALTRRTNSSDKA